MNTLNQPSVTFRPTAFLSGAPGPWIGHLPFACDLIAALKPQTIVELGVAYGDSYFGLCQAVAENGLACSCHGVDSWPSPDEDSVYEAVSRHNDRHYRAFSHLLRNTFEQALNQFPAQSIGLLHLDGAHSYETAQHDFDSWLPKVRRGGVILLHGIAVRSGESGIWRLWEDLQCKFPSFAFHNASGLGVLWNASEADDENAYLRELFCSSGDNQGRLRRYYNLCAERLELEHKLERERAEWEQTRKARERERASHNLLSQELSIARGNVEDLKAEIERLTTDQAESQNELTEARKLNSRLAATLDRERLQRTMMENSLFWQLTRPLRSVLARLRPLTRR